MSHLISESIFNQLSKKMQGANKSWLQFACYVGLLGTSLGLQVSRPDLFNLFCTQLPIQERLGVHLNSPVLPPTETERVK